MNDNEILEFEDRAYVSPTVSRDEQMEFINNYRNVLNNNVERINTQTHNLGTDVPSNLGGLTGADATFEQRYVTPNADAAVAELRAKAQETALTQSLNNLKAQMNKRYKDAYRNARIREQNAKKASDDTKIPLNVDDDTSYANGKLTVNGNYKAIMEPDGQGGTTGREIRIYPDGHQEIIDHNVKYSDPKQAAGMSEFLDLFTGKYNYTLDNGYEVELGGNDERLKYGSNGTYYIWNTKNNTYTPITGTSGNNSKNGGQSTWYKK